MEKSKRSEYLKKRRQEVPELFKARNKRYWDKLDLATKVWRQARGRAKRKGIKFEISVSDIVIPEKCPLLEVELVRGTKGDYSQTHSLDRIISSKGYEKGNTQVLSMKANSMKNSATLDELLIFSKNIILQNKNHPIALKLKELLN